MNPPVRYGMYRTILRSLGAALLIAASQVAAAAQMPAENEGWATAQAYGPSVGDPKRGRIVAEGKCAACHGADGNSRDAQFPKLAGQKQAYLYRQLWLFKIGARPSKVMPDIVALLTDADLANASSYYTEQTIRPEVVKDEALASTGQRIFYGGAGYGMAPPCAMCHDTAGRGMMMGRMPMMGMMGHGMMGHGMMASVPNLKGQHAAYIVDQLTRFASGERQAMMMGRIAAGLSEIDRKAVAEFLSGLR